MKPNAATEARFTQTQWTRVLAASDPKSAQAQQALAALCQSYWQPLYAFIRRRGHGPHEAQDLTQSFFVHLFERDALQRVDRAKGRFRSFLLGALQHFLASEWEKARTLKRGGLVELISWDQAAAESFYNHEPADGVDPERLFDRHWAGALVRQASDRLKREQSAAGKAPLFAALQSYLTGETGSGAYAQAASTLNMSEGAVKVALHRLRRRFGELLRAEIAETVSLQEEIDQEVRHLFGVLGSG